MIRDSSLGMGYPDRRIGLAGDRCASPPDGRSGRNARYAMRDIGPATFSVFPMGGLPFFRTGAPFRGVGASRTRTPVSMDRIPCGVLSTVIADPEGSGALPGMQCPDGRVPVASDGSEHFRSRKPHCGQSPTRRAGGGAGYFHGFVCASLVAPVQSRSLPSAPELVHRPARTGPFVVGCGRSVWATIPTPANHSAKQSKPRVATSSSCASRQATRHG